MLDKEVLLNFKGKIVQLINDEYFVKKGKILDVYDSSIAFFTDGKIIYIGFDRIKEIRPLQGDAL